MAALGEGGEGGDGVGLGMLEDDGCGGCVLELGGVGMAVELPGVTVGEGVGVVE